MLFKHSTQTAQEAIFLAPDRLRFDMAEAAVAPLPSKEEAEIAALSETNEALRREIGALRASWQEDLASAEARARSAAAQEHVQNDAKRLTMLEASLESARRTFEEQLLAMIGEGARELAAAALAKLVALRQADSDWLARIVEQRLADIGPGVAVALRVPPSELEGALAAVLPPGTCLEADATLRPGTARLSLRLGAIEIDPAGGLSRLLELLRKEGSGD